MFFFIYQLILKEKNQKSSFFFKKSQKNRGISLKIHETPINDYVSSYRLRLADDGIFNKSRYLATVLREISMPSSFKSSTNF